MKTEKNSLDELFKAGLDKFTEQPSRNLWRRISWNLLRKEIIHFNFSNIPSTWITIPATAIVLIALSIYIFNTSENDQLPQTNQIPENIKDHKSPSKSDQQSYGNDNTIAGQTGQNDSKESENSPEINDDAQLAQLDVQHSQSLTQQIENTDAITGAEPERSVSIFQQKNELPASASSTRDVTAFEQPEEKTTDIGSLTEEHQDAKASLVSPVKVEEDKTMTETAMNEPVNLARISTVSILPFTSDEQKLIESENQGLGAEVLVRSTTKFPDAMESGKVQSLHSINHSINYFLRGRYKPPKREFQTQTIKNQKNKFSHITLTTYGSPEITEYARRASASTEKSFSGGIAIGYNNPKYLIEGGIEFSCVYDLGDFMVNLKTYDSIGYYQYINGFTIDPENPGNIIYETTEIGVWDSIQHNSHQQTCNQYTYLQIPIMFGYKAMESGNFSAYVKAGPSFSIMLTKEEPALIFYQQGASVNSIENYSSPRMTTNIQLLVSLGLRYQLTENMGLVAEPYYRQYLRTVYDTTPLEEKLKNPFGIGVRAGIFYTF
ncbi:MAG: hypothetical protein EOM06_00400 [Sphingobacteriia bacterium]|nr:hypothetical protein [Sphingobacteriia bacterium]